MNKKLIILGSARSNGHTRKLIDHLLERDAYDVIDLLNYKIGNYDYEYKNADDDFLPLMQSIITKYDTFIFATPVYWYSMSAMMKTFFDRISDLLRTDKGLGRQLRGKSMGMISCSGQDDRNEHFAEPFELTAGYLGMTWIGDIHGFLEADESISEEVKLRLKQFSVG
ncbi:MAG: multimeric flavodoxin WrbA [Polaribacter sp.]|jgi:multimeric flavodoxin WrbA